MSADARRALPSVHALLGRPELAGAAEREGHDQVVEAARTVLHEARRADGGAPPDAGALAAAVARRLAAWAAPSPRAVINATGVVLHTNLGRAPVSAATARAMAEAAAGYVDLEHDLDTGARTSRQRAVGPLLARLAGAEAGLVVNNNAGALMLILAALAAGRSVVVSRGQLVEIGGGFRLPDLLAASGARLVEVGTTNRTYLRDFEAALAEDGGAGRDAALLLRIHPSNFRMTGYVRAVELSDMAALGRARGIPVVDDLGSGSLLDPTGFDLPPEPIVPDAAAVADLVAFSGDKLLGGPQAGLVVGRADLVAALRRHPLARALRPDKTTLAGLAATLGHYARGEAPAAVPVWRMLSADPAALAARAAAWRDALAARAPGASLSLEPGRSAVGGGALPGATLPTTRLVTRVERPDALAAALRRGTGARTEEAPVVARVVDGAVALDPRTVLPEEDGALIAALAAALAGGGAAASAPRAEAGRSADDDAGAAP